MAYDDEETDSTYGGGMGRMGGSNTVFHPWEQRLCLLWAQKTN